MSLLGENIWINGLIIIFGSAVLVFIGGVFSMLYRGIDRKLVAHMQGRVGPPIVQPFRDVQKLMMKESIIPDGAVQWLPLDRNVGRQSRERLQSAGVFTSCLMAAAF